MSREPTDDDVRGVAGMIEKLIAACMRVGLSRSEAIGAIYGFAAREISDSGTTLGEMNAINTQLWGSVGKAQS